MTDSVAYPRILDGHNDTLLRLHQARSASAPRPFAERSEKGHVDLPRMQEGGMAGGFFAMYAPEEATATVERSIYHGLAEAVDHRYALDYVLHLFALLHDLVKELDDTFVLVRSVPELQRALESHACVAIAHIEDAVPIDEDLDLLPLLYELGLRSVGLVWSRPNVFGTGVPFTFPSSPDTGPGLTPAGKELVRTCNQLGILVDLSHLNEKGFWDVAELTEAPLVATHSCAHALSPSSRNLTDPQLDAVAESEGIVGINFNVGFLREDGEAEATTSCAEIVRHAQYMAERMGIDHVALGSDFDGALMPGDLPDCSHLPVLMAKLEAAGFTYDELALLAHGNWVRVLERTWK